MKCDSCQFKIVEEEHMPATTDAAIRKLLCICFPFDIHVFEHTRHWHGSAPAFSLIDGQGDGVLGHVGVVVRLVHCGNTPALVAGIQNLAVHPESRGSGVGRQLMVEAMDEARRRNIRWGLLFCLPELEKFYGSLGWDVVYDTVLMKDPQGGESRISGKNICMSKCLESSPLPRGDIHLLGADW